MKLFEGYRPSPTEQFIKNGWTNGPNKPDYQGVEFDDGSVAVRWLTQYRSTSHWDNMATFLHVYGSPDTETEIHPVYEGGNAWP